MTADGIMIVRIIFVDILRLFMSFRIPGTNTTPFALAMFSLSVIVALKLLRTYFLGGGPGSGE